jgi:hypothetical protein
MNQVARLANINLDCEIVIAQIIQEFASLGLRVMRSFDLKSTTAINDFACSHHADQFCDCQLVVLLVYSADSVPASIVVHSHRGKTEVDLADSPNNRPGLELEKIIRLAFETNIAASLFTEEWSDGI